MTSASPWPDVWILRHGQTEWNVENRLQGRLDSPLTPLGVSQAKAQGRLLRAAGLPADVQVRISPAGRVQHSAALALEGLDWPVTVDPDLVEIGLGDWQGRTLTEVATACPDLDMSADLHLWKFTGPGCETLDEMVARARRALAALTGPTVLITHGITSRVLRCLLLGLPPERLSGLPGGQGVVHYLSEGQAHLLSSEAEQAQEDERNGPKR